MYDRDCVDDTMMSHRHIANNVVVVVVVVVVVDDDEDDEDDDDDDDDDDDEDEDEDEVEDERGKCDDQRGLLYFSIFFD